MEILMQKPKMFLGALSKDGFASDFAGIYSAQEGWHAYILKGGPGTGKSTLMKQIASCAASKGETVWLSPCSSDPNSLDAVILPQSKCVVLDGTAPHVVEPQYPIVCENIVNLGECVDADKIEPFRANVFAVQQEHALYVARANRFIRAAAQPLADNYFLQAKHLNMNKINNTAKHLIGEYLPRKSTGAARQTFCRLSAVTPQGFMFFSNTPALICGNTVVIEDEYGAAANALLKLVETAALEKGCRVITARNPLFPNTAIDAVMLPELGVAFCRQCSFMHPKTNNRIIHSRRFVPAVNMREIKQKLSFNKRIANTLLAEAVLSMQGANLVHAKLEKYYVSALNFSKVSEIAEELINKMFSKKNIDK